MHMCNYFSLIHYLNKIIVEYYVRLTFGKKISCSFLILLLDLIFLTFLFKYSVYE